MQVNNYILPLPKEIMKQIFLFTDDDTITDIIMVSKECFEIIYEYNEQLIHNVRGFGKTAWERRFDLKVSNALLPINIDTILSSKCPFNKDKLVKDTHDLILIPKLRIEDIKKLVLLNFKKMHCETNPIFAKKWTEVHESNIKAGACNCIPCKQFTIIDEFIKEVEDPYWILTPRKKFIEAFDYLSFQEEMKQLGIEGKYWIPMAVQNLLTIILRPRTQEETYTSLKNLNVQKLLDDPLNIPIHKKEIRLMSIEENYEDAYRCRPSVSAVNGFLTIHKDYAYGDDEIGHPRYIPVCLPHAL